MPVEFRCPDPGLCLTFAARSRVGPPSREQAGDDYREATMISTRVSRRLAGHCDRVGSAPGAVQ